MKGRAQAGVGLNKEISQLGFGAIALNGTMFRLAGLMAGVKREKGAGRA